MSETSRARFSTLTEISTSHEMEGGVRLKAKGSDGVLEVICDQTGTSIRLAVGIESHYYISKGSLASVSFYKKSQPWYIVSGITLMIMGIVILSPGYLNDFQAFLGIGIIIIGVIQIVVFFLRRIVTLEFETTGGKIIDFSLTGLAAKSGDVLTQFCYVATDPETLAGIFDD